MGLTAAFNNQRLYLMLVQIVHQLGQCPLAGENESLGIRTVPVADSQLGVVALKGGMSY